MARGTVAHPPQERTAIACKQAETDRTTHTALHVGDANYQTTPQLLAALVGKSLLRWDGVAYYDMHELVRQYASEKLAEIGEAEKVGNQHLAYYG